MLLPVLNELRQHDYYTKLGALALGTLASALCLRSASGLASPTARLCVVLPLLLFNSLAPLYFRRDTEPVSIAFCGFMVFWLGNFKALAWAVFRGPLAMQPWSVLQMWVLYVLPIVPQTPEHRAPRRQLMMEDPGSVWHLLLRWLLKAAVLSAVVFALLHEELLTPLAKSFLYCLGLYTMLGVVMDGPAALVLHPLRLTLAPHFMPPWESRSIAEFWGGRWNQAASNALRTLLFDPIVQGRLVDQPHLVPAGPADRGGSKPVRSRNSSTPIKQVSDAAPAAGNGSGDGLNSTVRRRSARLAAASAAAAATAAGDVAAGAGINGSKAGKAGSSSSSSSSSGGFIVGRRLAGMTAAFVASAIVHEIIFWYVSGAPTRHFAWMAFFVGQMPLILLERALLAALQRRGKLPSLWVQRVMTLSVLMATGHWLFFTPAEVAGVPKLFASSIRATVSEFAVAVSGLLPGH